MNDAVGEGADCWWQELTGLLARWVMKGVHQAIDVQGDREVTSVVWVTVFQGH